MSLNPPTSVAGNSAAAGKAASAGNGLEGLAAAGVPQPFGSPQDFRVESTVPRAAAVREAPSSVTTRLPQTLPETMQFLRDAWSNHGFKAVLLGLLILALTAAVIVLAPKKYRSEAQLFVRPGRESVTLDPTATTGETFNVSATRETEINSVLEILSSRANLDAVVDRMSPEVVLGEADLPDDAAMLASYDGQRVTFKPTGRASKEHTLAVTKLEKGIGLEAVRRSNVIEASCVSSDPELAQTLLTAFLDAAIERHMRASRSSGTLDFFREQTDDVNEQYRTAAAQLSDIKSNIGVSSLEERRKTLQAQYADLEAALSTTKADLAEAEASVAGLSAAMSEIDQNVRTSKTTGQPQDARGIAEARRSTLKIEREKFLASYTENHPKIKEIDAQLAEIEDLLKGKAGEGQSVEGTNPVWLALENQRLAATSEIAALNGRLEAEEEQLVEVRQRLSELNRNEGKIAGLEEQVRVLRTTAGDYTKKLEQARIDRALEDERLSNITITQPPTFVEKAVWPQRRLLAIAGVLLAGALALGLMLGRELLDRLTPQPAY